MTQDAEEGDLRVQYDAVSSGLCVSASSVHWELEEGGILYGVANESSAALALAGHVVHAVGDYWLVRNATQVGHRVLCEVARTSWMACFERGKLRIHRTPASGRVQATDRRSVQFEFKVQTRYIVY